MTNDLNMALFQQPNHDFIHSLPIVNVQPSSEELRIADTIFNSKNTSAKNDMKEIVLIAILFVLFSLPQTDELIARFLPSIQNLTYAKMGVKVLLVVILFWIIKNFAESRR